MNLNINKKNKIINILTLTCLALITIYFFRVLFVANVETSQVFLSILLGSTFIYFAFRTIEITSSSLFF